eukprot:Protomagalhaensia_sp_Gyna_25__1577@NODE_1810_length_1510_cov_110_363018_g1486_i0_p1_GENE_NODE_1810_length_1510_cov_110_363018_g1486_i0NODE_1810_length_1510_cov_110_363018_g1486_i0_p1_ORF_typecomplete_len202_score32_79DZF/PF07528_14/0_081_NODE_1810_length_1510_cov_110_363018_g1486_i0374979
MSSSILGAAAAAVLQPLGFCQYPDAPVTLVSPTMDQARQVLYPWGQQVFYLVDQVPVTKEHQATMMNQTFVPQYQTQEPETNFQIDSQTSQASLSKTLTNKQTVDSIEGPLSVADHQIETELEEIRRTKWSTDRNEQMKPMKLDTVNGQQALFKPSGSQVLSDKITNVKNFAIVDRESKHRYLYVEAKSLPVETLDDVVSA